MANLSRITRAGSLILPDIEVINLRLSFANVVVHYDDAGIVALDNDDAENGAGVALDNDDAENGAGVAPIGREWGVALL